MKLKKERKKSFLPSFPQIPLSDFSMLGHLAASIQSKPLRCICVVFVSRFGLRVIQSDLVHQFTGPRFS